MEAKFSLVELSRTISQSTKVIEDFLQSNNLPFPSLSGDAPLDFPAALENATIHDARYKAMHAAKTLHDLLWGPEERSLHQFTTFIDAITVRILYRFKVFSSIPLESSIDYAELSEKASLPEPTLRRLLRHAMTLGYFIESENSISHTSSSAFLLRRPEKLAVLGFMSEVGYRSTAGLLEAMLCWPGSQRPEDTGFSVAYGVGGKEGMFDFMRTNKDLEAVYSEAMKALSNNPGMGEQFMLEGFDWAKLDNGTVVDVGGSTGHSTIPLARNFPSVHVIVQDLSNSSERSQSLIPADLRARVKFMPHDFFQPQPVIGADIYLLRWILHDWSDEYCVRILRALVPALINGARVLVAEGVLPARGVLPWPQERFLTSSDLMMMAFHNSKERSLEEFIALFEEADPQFRCLGFKRPQGSLLAFIEFSYTKNEHIN